MYNVIYCLKLSILSQILFLLKFLLFSSNMSLFAHKYYFVTQNAILGIIATKYQFLKIKCYLFAKDVFSVLKWHLYTKFGKNITLAPKCYFGHKMTFFF